MVSGPIDTDAIRAKHRIGPLEKSYPGHPVDICASCGPLGGKWPCDAVRLADALDATRAERDGNYNEMMTAWSLSSAACRRAERAEAELARVAADALVIDRERMKAEAELAEMAEAYRALELDHAAALEGQPRQVFTTEQFLEFLSHESHEANRRAVRAEEALARIEPLLADDMAYESPAVLKWFIRRAIDAVDGYDAYDGWTEENE